MKVFKLVLKNFDRKPYPEFLYCTEMVVIAENKDSARKIAAEYADNEGSWMWLDHEKSDILEISLDKERLITRKLK